MTGSGARDGLYGVGGFPFGSNGHSQECAAKLRTLLVAHLPRSERNADILDILVNLDEASMFAARYIGADAEVHELRNLIEGWSPRGVARNLEFARERREREGFDAADPVPQRRPNAFAPGGVVATPASAMLDVLARSLVDAMARRSALQTEVGDAQLARWLSAVSDAAALLVETGHFKVV